MVPVEGAKVSGTTGFVLFLVGIIFVGAIVSSGDPESSSSGYGSDSESGTAATPEISVTASELYRDYDANEVAADSRYRGRRLAVSGTVEEIRKDFLDNTILDLDTPNRFSSVRAELDDSQTTMAESLSKGTLITVVCEGRGSTMGSPILDDCIIQ
jgi:hypothetical protein